MADAITPTAAPSTTVTEPGSPDPKAPKPQPSARASTIIPTKPAPKAAPAPKPDASKAAGTDSEPKSQETAPPEDLFEIVEDGEKRQLTKEQAIRELQKRGASGKRFKEAKALAEKAQRFARGLTENPAAVLEEAGVDVEAFAEQILGRRAEEALLTPEERAQRDQERELEHYRSQDQKRKEEANLRQQEEQDRQIFGHLEKGFLAAAEKAGVAGTPDNLIRILEVASELLDMGIPATEDQVVAEMMEREDGAFRDLTKKVTKGLKGEKLARRLGPEVVEEVLRWSVEQLNAQNPYQKPAEPAPVEPVAKPDPSTVSETTFREKYKF